MTMEFLPVTKVGTPLATVNLCGQIYLNATARKVFKLDEFKTAILGFDSETCEVGIKLLKTNEGRKLDTSSSSSGAMLFAGRFLSYHNLLRGKKQTFSLYEKDEVLMFKAKKSKDAENAKET